MTATRFCKTCRFLTAVVLDPPRLLVTAESVQEIGYRCDWFSLGNWPWAMKPRPNPQSYFIGKRRASPEWCAENPMHPANAAAVGGSDWTEAMDCPTWEAKP